ncbi:symmetrical bis(5'-nucleosyl)-tetraphosphatase [Limnohabitans sp.]|uniref:symmetrical bis(5'-nucleosyl)-tetraphosphatase n=1 Tax=Limnohabitans sp. TaxID=1907725 RepID=UPI00286ED541|nr:symmetrical bis(5'-nucleosyl)-tetraphosphatase [Limnohabitans sp.]
MALYLIGDVQGCDEALDRLLTHLSFSPSRDTLYLLGDLVNRGPDNAAVLRRLMGYGSSAQCLLGNHDLHALAVSRGVRKPNPQDTLQDILTAPDSAALLHWLRHQHLAMQVGNVLMVHAGVLPQWTAQQTLALAGEVEAVLRSDDWVHFMPQMYGGLPNVWRDDLAGADRLRVIVNALTRLRFCDAHGAMDFSVKEGADKAPAHLLPWFDVPGRLTADVRIAFGHWSTVHIQDRADVACLDDGCVWGGCLSAAKLEASDTLFSVADAYAWERVSVTCPQTMDPLA